MADSTSIEWTATRNADGTVTAGATWNPIAAYNQGKRGWHCNKVSAGCLHCYAERLNRNPRFGNGLSYDVRNNNQVEYQLVNLDQPMRWKRPRKIFVCSMTDLFFEEYSVEMITQIIAAITLAPQHTFIVLTKRADRMQHIMSDGLDMVDVLQAMLKISGKEWIQLPRWPLPNLWLLVSCEDQRTFDDRYRSLLATPAAVRGLSLEPLIGPIDLRRALYVGEEGGVEYVGSKRQMIDWVICGGESGPGSRPMDPDWARLIRDDCKTAGVPYFFKQWGNLVTVDQAIAEHGFDPYASHKPYSYIESKSMHVNMTMPFVDLGKKVTGRLLDGCEHNGYPQSLQSILP